jgi:hypothetical protein
MIRLTWLQRESQHIVAVREGQVFFGRNEHHETGDIRIVVEKAECNSDVEGNVVSVCRVC